MPDTTTVILDLTPKWVDIVMVLAATAVEGNATARAELKRMAMAADELVAIRKAEREAK